MIIIPAKWYFDSFNWYLALHPPIQMMMSTPAIIAIKKFHKESPCTCSNSQEFLKRPLKVLTSKTGRAPAAEEREKFSSNRDEHLAQSLNKPSTAASQAKPWLANGKGSNSSTGLEVELRPQLPMFSQESSAKRAENVKQGVKVIYTGPISQCLS